jgi:predicted transcriptional regulator
MALAKRKVKATAKPAERRGVAFKLPGDLIDALDVIAAQENRSRAKQFEVALRQFVQSYQRRSAA